MTDHDFAQSQTSDLAIKFAASGVLYQLSDKATSMDVRDQLLARLSQLSAMLHMVCTGGGLERFQSMSNKVQENYIWTCAMLADECDGLSKHI